jgi:hypothetical protein
MINNSFSFVSSEGRLVISMLNRHFCQCPMQFHHMTQVFFQDQDSNIDPFSCRSQTIRIKLFDYLILAIYSNRFSYFE